jgi:HSP20 family protein
MTVIRRSPAVDVVAVRDAMERLFDDRFWRPIWRWDVDRETPPPLDLYTTPEAVIARIALPGVTRENVHVAIGDDVVTVRGSYEEEHEKTETGYVQQELNRGTFERSFALPIAVKAEAARAVFKDGVLTLTLPKTDEVKPRHLEVEVTG